MSHNLCVVLFWALYSFRHFTVHRVVVTVLWLACGGLLCCGYSVVGKRPKPMLFAVAAILNTSPSSLEARDLLCARVFSEVFCNTDSASNHLK